MKVKNEYVEISSGNRNIKIQNTILDIYLKEIPKIQFQTDRIPTDISFSIVYLRFDNTIDVTPDREIDTSDFDVYFSDTHMESNHIMEKIIVDYTYNIEQPEIQKHIGKKITAIGFGYSNGVSFNVGAVVDTRNYGLYIEEKKDFKVNRRDMFSSDGIFYSSDVQGMMHMFPFQKNGWRGNTDYKWGVLKSVGLGVSSNKIMEEYEFEDYNSEITMNDFGFDINREFTIEHLNEGLFPEQDLYPLTDLYPARIIREALYPNIDIYPRNRFISCRSTISIHTTEVSNISSFRRRIRKSYSIR